MLDLGHFKLHDLYGVNLDSERSNISKDPIMLSETTKLFERRALKVEFSGMFHIRRSNEHYLPPLTDTRSVFLVTWRNPCTRPRPSPFVVRSLISVLMVCDVSDRDRLHCTPPHVRGRVPQFLAD